MKTGYKGTYNFTCIDHKFEVGQTYELPNEPIPCKYGFHYCLNPIDVLEYYMIQRDFRLLEIEDLSKDTKTQDDKSVTNKIRIIREIPKEEYYQLFGMVNNELTIKCSDGYWIKRTYDEQNNKVYFKNAYGYWAKYEYDKNNNLISSEDSHGSCLQH